MLASFQDLEHEGNDTRLQGSIKIQGQRFKDLKSQDKSRPYLSSFMFCLKELKAMAAEIEAVDGPNDEALSHRKELRACTTDWLL
ncbi:hypothetical protein Tco_0726246 [Tanacetum coccineum]|uniref:Uncharacterized protein n=1 Tax=Tanacetum coccineum TaxID=301880 RepID=A0ABQ4YF40_9ASTR